MKPSTTRAVDIAAGVLLAAMPGLGSCAFDKGGVPVGGGSDAADVIDATVAPDADDRICVPWTATNVDPCDVVLPQRDPLVLARGSYTLNTDTGGLTPDGGPVQNLPHVVLQQPGGGSVRAINLSTLSIPADTVVRIVGALPLLLIVHGDATIDGTISASSVGGNLPVAGPGSNNIVCGTGLGGPGVDAGIGDGGGGGGGGAFGDDGGDGTPGEGGAGAGGSKGGKSSDEDLSPLRAGCAGGEGGDNTFVAGESGGRPGRGGGAVQITTRGTLTVGGQIDANGSGGRGGLVVRGGGAGGGSGGGIFLEAGVTVTLRPTAALCANGGGGGEGAETTGGSGGQPGADGACAELASSGGTSVQSDGGEGGNGGFRGDPKGAKAGNAVNASGAGGGGGGGGAGRIRIRGIGSPPAIGTPRVLSPEPTLG